MGQSTTYNEIELKSLIEDIVNGYINFINIDSLRDTIFNNIEQNYSKGLDSSEIKFNMNFVPDYNTVSFIQKFSFDNVKGLEKDIKDGLRRSLRLGLMNQESIPQLKQRIKDVMDISIERAELIARTESVRAFNMGSFQGAKNSGLSLIKEWSAADDERTCKVCGYLDGKRVGMNEHFVDSEGDTYFLSPAHPRCRCRVIYIQEDKSNNNI